MTKTVRPLHDRVIIRKDEAESITKSGIIIPDLAQETAKTGEVVAVGKGYQFDGNVIPLDIKVGDKVLFASYSGTSIKMNGEELHVMKEVDIIGVVE